MVPTFIASLCYREFDRISFVMLLRIMIEDQRISQFSEFRSEFSSQERGSVGIRSDASHPAAVRPPLSPVLQDPETSCGISSADPPPLVQGVAQGPALQSESTLAPRLSILITCGCTTPQTRSPLLHIFLSLLSLPHHRFPASSALRRASSAPSI